MSDCCSSTNPTPCRQDTHVCPMDGKVYKAVSEQTFLQHVRQPWKRKSQPMYFCSNPDCPVVYFGEDDTVLTQDALRTAVGIKNGSDEVTICYCFGVSRGEAKKDPGLRDFVIEQTRRKRCACEIRNPSGKCCLKDFPAAPKKA